MQLGFLGTGTITAAMVRGIKASRFSDWPILLSPRNAELAAELAAGLRDVEVAASNEDLVERSELVVLAVRPQIAEEVLRGLHFRADQQVISLIASLDHDRIREWTGVTEVCRAIPLPFVERLGDAVPVFPPLPQALALFDALGQALPVHDQSEFDLYAALSALMGSYFGIVETAQSWAVDRGLSDSPARAYLSRLFFNLGRELQESDHSLSELRVNHSTPGGLNEQAFTVLRDNGGLDALGTALSSVLDRIGTVARTSSDGLEESSPSKSFTVGQWPGTTQSEGA